MEIFRIDNKKYNVLCPKCDNIFKFKINHNKYLVEGECKNGHSYKDISFYNFKNSFIKNTTSTKIIKCYKCFKYKDSKSFLCQTCNKLFCFSCINNHLKEENHRNSKYFNNKDKLCQIHNSQNYFFCKNCNFNICQKCKILHLGHNILSLLDIFPNKEKRLLIKTKTKSFEENITKIKDKIKEKKKEIDEKFKNLDYYFNFLIDINNKLFKRYNYSIFDYYNYENFNYIFNFINEDKIFEEKKYLDFLFSFVKNNNSDSEEENDDINSIKINENNETTIANLNVNNNDNDNKPKYLLDFNYSNLHYFKDNIFLEISNDNERYNSKKFIKMFEFKEFSFNLIEKYDLDDHKQISSIKLAKYSNQILINYKRKKNIKFLEYESKTKILILSKKEIKSKNTSYFDNFFYDCIDFKNRDILTADKNELILWKKHNKNKYFKETMNFHQPYYKLYYINENVFMAYYDNLLTFFDLNKFEPIKSINSDEADFVSLLNNKLLIVQSIDKYMIISLKYFEISQIIENNEDYFPLIAKENKLIQYFIENKEITITKSEFNEEQGTFKKEEKKVLKTKCSIYAKILIADNNNLILCDNRLISIFSGAI